MTTPKCRASSDRAKARWAILRQALLTSNTNLPHNDNHNDNHKDNANDKRTTFCNRGNDERDEHTSMMTLQHENYSIHRFPGFQMLPRRVMGIYSSHAFKSFHPDDALIMDCLKFLFHNDKRQCILNDQKDYEIVQYEIPVGSYHSITASNNGANRHENMSCSSRNLILTTIERCQQNSKKMNLQELMSHVHYGVDNTGNTRVWDCSNVLAFLIMSDKKPPCSDSQSICYCHGEKDDALLFSKNEPFIGLADVLSLAQEIDLPTKNEVMDNNIICEGIHTMNGSTSRIHHNRRKMLRVLELGAGMAALPSLALAAFGKQWMSDQQTSEAFSSFVMDVTITDGHPHAVENNQSCVQLLNEMQGNSRQYGKNQQDNFGNDNDTHLVDLYQNNIQCHQLLWKRDKQGMIECQNLMELKALNETGKALYLPFDLLLVSDCTHFTDFHVDLAATIGRLLRVGGVCFLCQPRRGRSLQKFLDVIRAMNGDERRSDEPECARHKETKADDAGKKWKEEGGPLFQIDLHEKYHHDIYHQHLCLLREENKSYDADIHYPLLLILKKMRTFHEDQDIERAMSGA